MKLRNFILFTVLLLSSVIILSSLNVKETYTDDEILSNKIEEIKMGGGQTSPTSLKMYELIEKYSKLHSIPKYIAYNIAYLETRYQGPFHWNYKPNQTSSVGAVGPMQIMPATAKFINKTYVSTNVLRNDIELNIETSMKLLEHLYERYSDWALVCGCYNTGRPIINGYAKFCSSNKDYQKNWFYLSEI